MDDNNTFTIYADDGTPIECYVLFIYTDERTGKEYVAYSDDSIDDEGNTRVFAGILCGDPPSLQPIETDEEWEIIDGILASLSEDE